MADEKEIWNFIFEMAQLKRIWRSGWRLYGVECPESVADHSLRAAQIGYLLAKLEGFVRPEEVCTILVFHELAETRIGDVDKLANGYASYDELKAAKDQTVPLGDMGQEIFEMVAKITEVSGEAGKIAKDADYLELLATAKELMERGYRTEDMFVSVLPRLKTDSAKRLASALKEQTSTDWWQGLKKL